MVNAERSVNRVTKVEVCYPCSFHYLDNIRYIGFQVLLFFQNCKVNVLYCSQKTRFRIVYRLNVNRS